MGVGAAPEGFGSAPEGRGALAGRACAGSGAGWETHPRLLRGWLNTDQFSLKLETTFTNHSWEIFQLMPKLSDLPDPSDSVCDTGTPLAQGGLGVGANVTLTGAVIYGTADTPNSGVCGTSW